MESSGETATGNGNPISPCAGCKFLRRKCQINCVFAPYFPPDQQQKFVDVHRVFGASNITKILNDLLPSQREDAVKSLVFEAQMRLQDPVYGCVGIILVLEEQLQKLRFDLSCARAELSRLEAEAAGFGGRRIGMEELVFSDRLRSHQQRMVMMMMMSSGVNHSGLMATINASGSGSGSGSGSIGQQFRMPGDAGGGGGDDNWHPRGVEDYFP